MCNMASFVVTKDKVFWLPDNDSHEAIIKHYDLHEGAGRINFVRVEITPENNNYKLQHKRWIFNVDQQEVPDWFDKEEAEKRCRLELPKWYKAHVIKSGKHELSGIIYKIILGGEVKVTGQTGGSCGFYGNSQGKVTGQTDGYCGFYENSQGKVTGQTGGYCWFHGNSQGKVTGQTGGYCGFYDSSQGKVTGQTGGDCGFYENSKRLN